MNLINFIVENWAILVALLAAICVIVFFIKGFSQLPAQEQLIRVQEWLLYAVTKAEKELGSGTGQIKLRYVYDMFVDRFPALAKKITFDIFNTMVEQALTRMEEILITNTAVKDYVEPQKVTAKRVKRKAAVKEETQDVKEAVNIEADNQ